MENMTSIEDLLGKTATKVQNIGDQLIFVLEDGSTCGLSHSQECCESVTIEDICGDLDDLVGSPFLMSEEISNADEPTDIKRPQYHDECYEWTFYKFATIKGYVTVRWFGSSNGYYSTNVGFYHILKDD